MPSALDFYGRDDPASRLGLVGLRSLPHLKLHYYARTPKSNPFATVWLPVNASNRQVNDEVQDIMHLHYSRHCKSDDSVPSPRRSFELDIDHIPEVHKQSYSEFELPSKKVPTPTDSIKAAMWMTSNNSLAPFASLGKPTCGYYFSRGTDNRKRLTGVPATNLVKWRPKEVPAKQ